MHRRLFLLGVGALALLGLFGYLLLSQASLAPPLRPGVTKENFRNLHAGMTADDAAAILGCPGGEAILVGGGQTHRTWSDGKSLSVVLYFNQSGRVLTGWLTEQVSMGKVTSSYVVPLDLPPPGILDRLRRLLHW
jgi:hypothetical protein